MPRIVRHATLVLLLSVAAGCQGPRYYEKEDLARPIMKMDEDPALLHWLQKVLYSNEGAVGGVGTAGGGGCGCY